MIVTQISTTIERYMQIVLFGKNFVLETANILETIAKKCETWRIYLHLYRVELELRLRDVSHLSEVLQQERKRNIERLRKYRKERVFPQNIDFPGERIPYFKDAFGTPCAVAYLIEQSGQQEVVEMVRKTNNHVYVDEINEGPVFDWIKSSGLTKKEAARIQPTYDFIRSEFETVRQENKELKQRIEQDCNTRLQEPAVSPYIEVLFISLVVNIFFIIITTCLISYLLFYRHFISKSLNKKQILFIILTLVLFTVSIIGVIGIELQSIFQ